MVDGADKPAAMDGARQKRTAAAGKKGKKDDLDNLKKEVEMVNVTNRLYAWTLISEFFCTLSCISVPCGNLTRVMLLAELLIDKLLFHAFSGCCLQCLSCACRTSTKCR